MSKMYYTDPICEDWKFPLHFVRPETIIKKLRKLPKTGTLSVVLFSRDGTPDPCYGGLDKVEFMTDMMEKSLKGWIVIDAKMVNGGPGIRIAVPDDECNELRTNITPELLDELDKFLTSNTHENPEGLW